MKNKLSKRSQTLVNEFGAAAENHGWQEDQGAGSSVDNARENNDACKGALERHIARLEAKIPKPTKCNPRAAGDEHSHANWETAGGTTEEQNEARFAR